MKIDAKEILEKVKGFETEIESLKKENLDAKSTYDAEIIELKSATGLEKEALELKITEGTKSISERDEKIKSLETALEREKQSKNAPHVGGKDEKMNKATQKEFYESEKKEMNKVIFENFKEGSQAKQLEIHNFETKQMVTDSNTDGGFFLADTRSTVIRELAQPAGAFAQYANVENLSTGDTFLIDVEVNTADDGGYVGEREARTDGTTPQFEEVRIVAHEQEAVPTMSNKMMNNAGFDIVGYVDRYASKKMRQAREKAYIVGVGKCGPKGILKYGDGTNFDQIETVETEGSLKVGFTDVNNALAVLDTSYHANAVLVMNQKTRQMLRGEKDGQGRPLYRDSTERGTPDTYMDMPVVINSYMEDPTVAGNRCIAVADLMEAYTIVERSGVSLLVDNLTKRGFVKFINTAVNGGGVVKAEAIKLIKVKA